jgi:DNA-binding transcriptional LysR family regulator
MYSEPLTVALPAGHPLSQRPSVEVTDIADEPVLRCADAPAAWNAYWSLDPRPDGSRPRHGPEVHDMEEIVQYVRSGADVAFLPASVSTAFPRPDLAYVPITGGPAGKIVLAWDTSRETPLIRDFADLARQVCAVPE